MQERVQQLIAHYQMQPHPEGGCFLQTYKSSGSIPSSVLPEGFSGPRPFSTAIYFLLEQGNFSAFHRIRSDECWHFYEGQCLLVHILNPVGDLTTIRLGPDISNGELYQYVVPANSWFASEPAPGSAYSFVGCTVSPGFDFADFELAEADTLAAAYPDQALLIRRLCR
jgi:uncharacterized protein